MSAQAVAWALAGLLEEAPMTDVLDRYPEPAQEWVRGWLGTETDWCGHLGIPLLRPFGAHRLACVPCATAGHVEAYLERCGRCGSPVGIDGFGGVIARGDTVLILVSMCLTCAKEGGF